LRDIADHDREPWVGAICLPGGQRTADQLASFGAIEYVATDTRYVTLTPWSAQELLGVELFEFDDSQHPVWVRSSVVEQAIGDTPIVSRGIPHMVRLGDMSRLPSLAEPDETEVIHS